MARSLALLMSIFAAQAPLAIRATSVSGMTCPTSKSSTMVSVQPICVEAEAKYTANNVDTSGEVFTMKNSPPSDFEAIIKGFFSSQPDPAKISAYGISVGMLAIVPFLCCFGNGCCGWTHCCARTCCEVVCPSHCLAFMCRPNPKKPYSKLDKLLPILLMALFGGAASIAAISGIAGGTGRFENTYIRGACMVDTTRLRVTTFIDEFRAPVVSFKSVFGDISADVASRIGSVKEINDAMDNLASKYGDLKSAAAYHHGNESASDRGNLDCAALEAIEAAADSAQNEAIEAASNFADTMNQTGVSVNDTLIGFRDTINEAIDGADDLVKNLRAQVDNSLNSSSSTVLQLARYMKRNPNLTSGTAFGLFGWIFLLLGLFIFGFFLILLNSHEHVVAAGQVRSNRKLEGKILDVGHVGACGARFGALSWCLVFLFGAIASGTAMIFLPFSTVFTDVCVISEELPLNLGSWMPQAASSDPAALSPSSSNSDTSSGSSAGNVEIPVLDVNQIMSTCWNGGNIYDALNMKETIPINASEMFSGMEKVPSDGALPEEEFKKLKKVVDEDLENCTTGKARMQAGLAAIVSANSDLQQEIASYSQLLGGIETNSVNTLEAAINKIKCVKCNFIKVTWQDVFGILCKDARGGFRTVAEAATSIGFMSFFTSFAMLVVLRRWGGHGPLKAHDHGDDGLQLAITNKLESCCPCMSHHRKPVEGRYDASGSLDGAVEMMETEEITAKYTVNVEVNATANESGSVYAVQDPTMDEVEGEII